MTGAVPGAPRVLATAVVRARDGRSVLDRAPAEPAKAFVADPDRLHRAVATLQESGITVDGVDRVTISCRGPASAFESAFAIRLTYDTGPAGADPPAWRVGGATRFDVAATTPFGGLLHQVLLRAPAEPQGPVSFPVERAPVAPGTPTDLLLGELGESFGEGLPARLARHEPLDLDDPVAAARRTRRSLADWEDDLDRTGLVEHIGRIRALHDRDDPPRPETVLLEFGAQSGMAEEFRRLRGSGALPPLGVSATTRWQDAPDWAYLWPDPPTLRWARLVRDARGVIDEFADALDELVERRERGAAADSVFRALSALHAAVEDLAPLAAQMHADHPVGTWDGTQVRAAADLVEAALRPRTADPAAPLPEDLPEVIARCRTVGAWLGEQDAAHRLACDTVLLPHLWHSSMVVQAFLAVGLDAVGARLRTDVEPYSQLWCQRPTVTGAPLVVSFSVGASLAEGFTLAQARTIFDFRVRASPGGSRTLYVLAAGNAPPPPAVPPAGAPVPTGPTGPTGPTLPLDVPHHAVGYTAAAFDNVLTVGGWRPTATGWAACERTHGYAASFTDAAGNALLTDEAGRPVTFAVPHLCSVTEGSTGGAVLHTHADPEDRPGLSGWLRGAGSSLAVPTVAALCALVWSAFPSLTAAELAAAVLGGTEQITDGQFHRPQDKADGLTPGSHQAAQNPGARRAVLRKVLSRARDASGTAYTGAHPVLEPAAGARQ